MFKTIISLIKIIITFLPIFETIIYRFLLFNFDFNLFILAFSIQNTMQLTIICLLIVFILI